MTLKNENMNNYYRIILHKETLGVHIMMTDNIVKLWLLIK